MFCLPDLEKLPPALAKEVPTILGDFGLQNLQNALEDLTGAHMAYIYAGITCLVVATLYGLLIRYFAKILIWISVIGTGVGMVALALFMQHYHTQNYGPESANNPSVGNVLQVAVYVMYGAVGLYFLIVLCLCRDIAVSVAVLKTASIIIMRNIRVLLVPFIACIFILGYIALWLYGFGYLLSCANITQPRDGSQLKSIDLIGKDYLKW